MEQTLYEPTSQTRLSRRRHLCGSDLMRDPSALQLHKHWGVGLDKMEGPILIHFGKLKASLDY